MKHFDFEDILKSACRDKKEQQLLLMFLLHNPSFLEDPFGSNFYSGLGATLDLAPLKDLAPIRFPSDWTDSEERDLFLYLLFSSSFPFSMEWTGKDIEIIFPADGGWGRERKGFAPVHSLPISEVKKRLPVYFMQTMRIYYINDPEMEDAKTLLEETVRSLSEGIKGQIQISQAS